MRIGDLPQLRLTRFALLFLAGFLAFPGLLRADKVGLGRYAQDRQTCLPYAGANLIYGYSQSGFPNLLPGPGPTEERFDRMVKELIRRSGASYTQGTRTATFAPAVESYIRDCGYYAKVSQRGLYYGEPLTADWLKGNASFLRGYVLAFHTLTFVPMQGRYTYTKEDVGHAVTLVSLRGDTMRVNDSAHYQGGASEKLLRFMPNGAPLDPTIAVRDSSEAYVVTGLDLFDKPRPNTIVVLCEAVCVEIARSEQEFSRLGATTTTASTTPPAESAQVGSSPTEPPVGGLPSSPGFFARFGTAGTLGLVLVPFGLMAVAWSVFVPAEKTTAPAAIRAQPAKKQSSRGPTLFAPEPSTPMRSRSLFGIDSGPLLNQSGTTFAPSSATAGASVPVMQSVYRREVYRLFTERYGVDLANVPGAADIIASAHGESLPVEECARVIVAECQI